MKRCGISGIVLIIGTVALLLVRNANGQCSVCPDGSSIPEDKEDVNIPGTGQSCGTLSTLARFTQPDSIECSGFQVAASIFCGCPIDQTTPEGKCGLCAAGTILSDDELDIIVPTDDESELTCGGLLVSSKDLDEDSEDCAASQLIGEGYCGCEVVRDAGTCTMCADGSIPSDDDLENEIPATEGGTTCRQLLAFASASGPPGSDECDGVQFIGTNYCGCPPPDDTCTVCADGSDPDDGDDGGFGFSCSSVGNFIASGATSGSKLCGAIQTIIGPLCGCDPPEDVPEICRACGPPGTDLPDPTRIVSLPSVGSTFPEACFFKEIELATEVAPDTGCDATPFREALAAACCDCADSDNGDNVEIIEKAGGRKTCSWLAEQDKSIIDLHCLNFGRVRRGCRALCNTCNTGGKCINKDDKFAFRQYDSSMQSCEWIAKKKRPKRRKICKFSPDARKSCRLSCDSCP